MNRRRALIRHLVTVALGAFLAAGAGAGPRDAAAAGLDSVAAPVYRVGDRWVYRGEDGFRVKTRWEETHEITRVGPDGITMRVTKRGDTGDAVRTEQWPAPGLVSVGAMFDNETRRFTTPLKRYEYPLSAGQRWSQWVDQFDESRQHQGQVNHYVRVTGQASVTTAAGTFDTLKLRILMRLDDEDAFRWATECNYVAWYSPAARNVVRMEREAQYLEKSGDSSVIPIRTQHGTLELVAFTPGPG
jgi:hypothetical protein